AARSVVGFDVSGASSANTSQKAFLEFDLSAPIGTTGRVCVVRAKRGKSTHRTTIRTYNKSFGRCVSDLEDERKRAEQEQERAQANAALTDITIEEETQSHRAVCIVRAKRGGGGRRETIRTYDKSSAHCADDLEVEKRRAAEREADAKAYATLTDITI